MPTETKTVTKTTKTKTKPNKTKKQKKSKNKYALMKTSPFPLKSLAKLKYGWNDALATSTVQSQAGNWEGVNLNSVIHPYISVDAGQQEGQELPLSYNEFGTYYQKFKVYGANIRLKLSPNLTGKNCTLVCCVDNSVQDYNLTGGSIRSFGKRENIWTYPVLPNETFKFSRYVHIAKADGVKQSAFAAMEEYEGTTNSSVAGFSTNDPKKLVKFKIALINESDNSAVEIPFELDIEYITLFYERERLAPSYSTA